MGFRYSFFQPFFGFRFIQSSRDSKPCDPDHSALGCLFRPINGRLRSKLGVCSGFGRTGCFLCHYCSLGCLSKSIRVHFRIDSRGVSLTTRKGTRKKNAVINGLLFFLGLFSGKPGAVGMAILGESQQAWSMSWKDVREVKVYPKQRVVMLKSLWRKLPIYCTPENYETVVKMCYSLYRQAKPKR